MRSIILQILRGVEYLETQGIVHRDLKPGNILIRSKENLEKDDNLKIIDFGLSHCKQAVTSRRCGTPGYIAPEILYTPEDEFERILNSKIDVFSVGVILHLLLFGTKIFQNATQIDEILEKTAKGDFTIKGISEMITDTKSPNALDLVKRMLEVDQKKRIGVAEAINHPFFSENEELTEDEGKPMEFQISNIQENQDISDYNNQISIYLNLKKKQNQQTGSRAAKTE